MKSYTDLEQSKKLAEILTIESADMYYSKHSFENYYSPIPHIGNYSVIHDQIPCWSLAALLRKLPDTMLGKDKDGYVVMVETMGSGLTTFASDPIDACYKMICQLKEKDLI